MAFLIFFRGICLSVSRGGRRDDGRKRKNVYRSASAETDGVSLMFNVYWGTDEVYRILDTLETHKAKATFYRRLLGRRQRSLRQGNSFPRSRAGQSRLFP
ncbi:MAG: hypothetical protein ACLR06_10575 [Christensenellaceae bacterium]